MRYIFVVFALTGCALLPESDVADIGRALLDDYCSLPKHERSAYRSLINQGPHKLVVECGND